MKTDTSPAAVLDALDLDAFEDVMVSTLTLTNPKTGTPTASTIDILGPEHPDRKKLAIDRTRKLRTEFQRQGKIVPTDPLEDIEAETDYLVACTQGWSLTVGGQALVYTPQAARELYTNPKRQWVRVQVKKALEDADRFISSSAKA